MHAHAHTHLIPVIRIEKHAHTCKSTDPHGFKTDSDETAFDQMSICSRLPHPPADGVLPGALRVCACKANAANKFTGNKKYQGCFIWHPMTHPTPTASSSFLVLILLSFTSIQFSSPPPSSPWPSIHPALLRRDLSLPPPAWSFFPLFRPADLNQTNTYFSRKETTFICCWWRWSSLIVGSKQEVDLFWFVCVWLFHMIDGHILVFKMWFLTFHHSKNQKYAAFSHF